MSVKCQEIYFSEFTQGDQFVIENMEFLFKCNVSNRNGVVIEWHLNDNIIQNTSRRYQIDSYLFIKKVDRVLDSGEYRCIAIELGTQYSMESSASNLIVNWLENNVTVNGINEVLKQYSMIEIECLAFGSKHPIVEWYRNGERVYLIENKYEIEEDNKLIIYDLNKDDIGVYSCKAIIELSEYNVYSLFSINNYVLKINFNNTLYPRILYITANGGVVKTFNGQSNLKLDCVYENYEKIEWYFNDTMKKLSSSYSIHQNGTLVIPNVKSNDNGFFICRAINRGYKVTYSIRVEVLTIYDLQAYPPSKSKENIYISQLNRKFSLLCVYPTIDPKYSDVESVQWYKGLFNNENELNIDYLIENDEENGILEIDELSHWDSSNYTCTIKVKNITKFLTISLYTIDKPIMTKMPSDQLMTNKNIKFECEFEIPIQDNLPNVAINELYSKININWYFLPANNNNQNWKFIFNETLSDENNLIGKNKFLSKLDLIVDDLSLGSYKCEINIENIDTVSSNSANLYINSPREIIVNDKIIAIKDKNLLLNCPYKGNFDYVTDIKWMLPDNKTIVNVDNKSIFIKLLENKSLLLINITKHDIGVYTCIVSTSTNGNEIIKSLVLFNDSDENLPKKKQIEQIRKHVHLSIRQTIIIIISCALIYIITSVLLIIYCKKKLFKKKLNFNRNNEILINLDSNILNKKYTQNDINEESQMFDYQRKSFRQSSNSSQNEIKKISTQHQYENIEEDLTKQDEIKKFIEANNGVRINNQKEIADLRYLSTSQTSSSTNLTLTSVTRYDSSADEYLKSLKNFLIYGKCCYGDVYIANSNSYKNSSRKNIGKKTVLLKILRNLTHEQSIYEFHRDIEIYSKLNHENIVKLIDICTDVEGEPPNIVILEHTDLGDLKEYLLQKSHSDNYLSIFEKVHICYQIALAMQHFEQKLLVHGDLAARNCIVYLNVKNSSFVHVKVSNIGLSVDKYQNEYTYLSTIINNIPFNSDTFPIPLRWQAPELILESKQSIKSDLWSFAVCCWEVWKDGQLPYDDLSDLEVYQALKNYDLYQLDSLADLCPQDMWNLMEKCWLETTEMRPNFHNCVTILHSLLNGFN